MESFRKESLSSVQNISNEDLKRKYISTLTALGASEEFLLDIFQFIKIINYEIDDSTFKKFWEFITENNFIYIDLDLLKLLGFDKKFNIIKFLSSNHIKYKKLCFSELEQHIQILENKVYDKKKNIIIDSENFKYLTMCLKTKKSEEIKKYYASVENLFKMYCEYTVHFQIRQIEKNEKKKAKEATEHMNNQLWKAEHIIKSKDHKIDLFIKDIQYIESENLKKYMSLENKLNEILEYNKKIIIENDKLTQELNKAFLIKKSIYI